MALRSLSPHGCALDDPRTHPKATVVALAEGLQTSSPRLDEATANPQFNWVSVDLQPVIELRQRLLPSSRGSPASASRPSTTAGWTRSTAARGLHHC